MCTYEFDSIPFIFVFLCIGHSGNAYAQNSIFVLVDVSASGPEPWVKTQARDIVRDLINNQYAANRYDARWHWSASVQSPLDKLQAEIGDKAAALGALWRQKQLEYILDDRCLTFYNI